MEPRRYDALVLDVDGTLLDDDEHISPRTLSALQRARAQGVRVMLATGRSSGGVRPVLRALELDTPAIVYNGAGLYGPAEDRLIECYTLPEPTVLRVLAHAAGTRLLPIVARTDGQFARPAQTPEERRVLHAFQQLAEIAEDSLPSTGAIRLTLLSATHPDSQLLYTEIERVVAEPAYMTHFPLAALAAFRDSSVQVVDVQPACAGKAEAFRVLEARYGIPKSRVVCVGDAANDLPMLIEAGLGVAMGNATPDTKAAARRVIGDNNGNALALLIEELFIR